MNRKLLLTVILGTYTAFFTMSAIWGITVWAASSPVSNLSVKGASTDTVLSKSQMLSNYPVQIKELPSPINAREYSLYNPESGKYLAHSAVMDQVPIASTTKLMTTYIVAKHGNLQDVVTISSEAATQTGSLMGIATGEKLRIHDLLQGALMVSGNDAVYALAEKVGGDLLGNPQAPSMDKVQRFVGEMNKEASILHMQNTKYQDPAGLNDKGHSTADDLAKIASFVNEEPTLQKIIATSDATVIDQRGLYRHDLHNSNRLLTDFKYDGVLGGKTGFTYDAGHCLISSARRNGITLIGVVLHTDLDTADASANEVRKLLDFGFSSFRWE
jgi:D-alanyl-D-alanine carboxypeptidase (penicillin-binding protein 5/6)